MANSSIDPTAVVVHGRAGNAIVLEEDGNIIITVQSKDEQPKATITINGDSGEIVVHGEKITLESSERGELYSSVYGERLIELLQFLLNTMMRHQHPPNAPPIPDFFAQADTYKRILDDWLVNTSIRIREDV